MTGAAQRLSRSISGPQFFAIAFGSVVGVGWIVVMGDAVNRAGPVGTALALGVGGLAVTLVALCYAEMAARLPAAGGEIVYAHELGGKRGGALAAYATGWTMALLYTAACAFEAISIGQLFGMLIPATKGALLYDVLGQDVHLGSLVVGAGFAIGLAALNTTGARATALAQEWVTYGRLLLMILFLGIAIAWAEPGNLQPLIPGATPGAQFGAFLAVVGTAPFWYAGFNVAATAAEESGTSMRTAGRAVVIAVLAAAAFYIALVLAVSAMVPRAVLVTLDLPAAQAFEVAMGSPTVARLVLATAILGNLTAWNALLMAGSRVFFALGRAQLSPSSFARLGPSGTPVTGILIVTLVTLGALPMGRGFILPIVNLTSACFAITYLITCLALLKLRRSGTSAAFTAPGGSLLVTAAAISSVVIFLVAMIQPWLAGPDVPAEALALAGWMTFAAVLWLVMRRSILAVPDADRARQLRGDVVDNV